jgi:hypothetical protein
MATSNNPGWIVDISPAAVEAVIMNGSVEQAVRRAAFKVKERVISGMAARTSTGTMRGSVFAVSSLGGTRLSREWRVEARAPHTMYQEAGTRAHGPVRARFLVFTPKGGSRPVFARWVRGVSAARFMQRAADQTTVADFM